MPLSFSLSFSSHTCTHSLTSLTVSFTYSLTPPPTHSLHLFTHLPTTRSLTHSLTQSMFTLSHTHTHIMKTAPPVPTTSLSPSPHISCLFSHFGFYDKNMKMVDCVDQEVSCCVFHLSAGVGSVAAAGNTLHIFTLSKHFQNTFKM